MNKNYHTCKKDYGWNPSTCSCENGKYPKSVADTSVVTCHEIIHVMDVVSTKLTSGIGTNSTSTVSINCRNKKVRYKLIPIVCIQFY